SNDISVFYGRGDGAFTDQVRLPVGTEPSGIATGDFKGDGRIDIAISDAGSDDIRVLFATGARTYESTMSLPTGSQPWYVRTADLNGDGILDLAVSDFASTSPSVVSIYL